MKLRAVFQRAGRVQLTRAELHAAGVASGAIRRAVARGDLREGITGLWLVAPPDPGAVSVMRAAMGDREGPDHG